MTKAYNEKELALLMDRRLKGLLKSPKTRAGLVAAAGSTNVSPNRVYGWLTQAVRAGVVVKFKSTDKVVYSLQKIARLETPRQGLYPTWLEPRILPEFSKQTVHLCQDEVEDQQEEEQENDSPSLVLLRVNSFSDSVRDGLLGCGPLER